MSSRKVLGDLPIDLSCDDEQVVLVEEEEDLSCQDELYFIEEDDFEVAEEIVCSNIGDNTSSDQVAMQTDETVACSNIGDAAAQSANQQLQAQLMGTPFRYRRCPKAYEDPALMTSRVLRNMLRRENQYLINSRYFFDVQKDIEVWMRNKVAGWMLEVCVEQNCENEVYLTALNYMDRFLSTTYISRTQLQLLGAAAMFVASKLIDTIPMRAHMLVIYTDCSVTIKDLLSWEQALMAKLNWDLSSITPCDFFEQYVNRLPVRKELLTTLRTHAQTYTSLCYATEFAFATYPASMTAAACVSAAVHKLCENATECDVILQDLSAVDHENLAELRGQILRQVAESQRFSEQENLPSTPNSKPPNRYPTTPVDVRDVELL